MAALKLCNILAFLMLCIFANSVHSYIEKPGARYPITKGEVWPKPQNQEKLEGLMAVDPKNFKFQNVGKSCAILEEAFVRYNKIIALQGGGDGSFSSAQRADNTPTLETLSVNLTSDCEHWPVLNMEESYNLEVKGCPAMLSSKSIWGILRGLESFSQLIHVEDNLTTDLFINKTTIYDFPRFSHRGLLIDTSRHYLTLETLYKIIDGMTYNKFNVFHWHIIDDHSFPYESVKFPTLSKMGAYHPKLTYSPQDVQKVIEYARIRAIRVMPEFDTPGHTRSWGVAYPELLTQCYTDGKPNGDLGPMNPVSENVYAFMKDLLTEVVDVFPDNFLHLGGDEVEFECWESNPQIAEYMAANEITSFTKLEEIYIQRIVDMVNDLKTIPVVWQEVFLNGVNLPSGTVVHAWTGNRQDLLGNITAKGLPALLSSCWYLDHLANGGDWQKYYDCDPHDFPGTEEQKKLVLGGEACMWAEVVDNNNVLTRIFPRASATAEKLWSAVNVNDYAEARFRMEEHYCRMNKRGYPAQPPNAPGFCI